MQGDELGAYARKAYETEGLRKTIRDVEAADRVMYAGRRRLRLRPWQRWMNQAMAPVRGGIERIFGSLKPIFDSWGRREGLKAADFLRLRVVEAENVVPRQA